MSEANLVGKVALITGGNRGIGLQTARDLGKLGVTVVIGARNLEKGNEAVETLRSENIQAENIILDVNKPEDHESAYHYFQDKYGRLDILINNAGVQFEVEDLAPMNNVLSISQDVLRATFEANYFNVVAITQKLLPLIRKSSAGRIVNVSSILGSLTLQGNPESPIYGSKLLAYNSTKSALNMFTIQLAEALKDTPIKVNSVHPGWVKTKLGGKYANTEVEDSSKASVKAATLSDDGPSGSFFDKDNELPW
jgi:NAD(P)-dependent dehydrogenase (short-subunit alcohol dehydrogenase family)